MSNLNVEEKKSRRIFYLDALRALAIISVIIYHIFVRANFIVVGDYGIIPSFNWFFTDIMGTFFRCGVDIFLMLSGALSLGRIWDIKSFLGKRLPRIVEPFLFWLFVIGIGVLLLNLLCPSFFDGFKNYIPIKTYSIVSILTFFYNASLGYNIWFGQYWFFWMILGTYLIMPIFNKWLFNADLKEAEYFLVFWLITCLFTYTLNINFPVNLKYFTGPIGMVVLGYYLRHTQRKIFNNVWISVLLTILPAIAMVICSYYMSSTKAIVDFNRYSIFLAIEVMGIFTLFKNIGQLNININFFSNPEGIFRKSIFSIAKYSYGMYLTHFAILNALLLIFIPHVHYKVLVLILFFGTLVFSWAILAILNRVPYINKVIGAK